MVERPYKDVFSGMLIAIINLMSGLCCYAGQRQ